MKSVKYTIVLRTRMAYSRIKVVSEKGDTNLAQKNNLPVLKIKIVIKSGNTSLL